MYTTGKKLILTDDDLEPELGVTNISVDAAQLLRALALRGK